MDSVRCIVSSFGPGVTCRVERGLVYVGVFCFEFFEDVMGVVGVVKGVDREFPEWSGVLMELVIGHFIGGWVVVYSSPRPFERREVKRLDRFV